VGFLVGKIAGLAALIVAWFVIFAISPQVSPKLLLRLYRAQPLSYAQAPTLVSLVTELSQRANLSCVPTLYYIPSRVVNAFSLGTCNTAAIGITDGLVRGLSLRELSGVLAHEVSHIRNNDVWVMGLADLISRTTRILSWIGQIVLIIFLPFFILARADVPWLLVLLLILAPTITALLQLALSRTREYRADLEAARITGDPQGLASALKKLELLGGGLFERIFFPGSRNPDPSILRTHPPTEERIRRLLELQETAFPARPPALAFTDEQPFTPEHMPPIVVRVPTWHVTGLWH
jgi:heat shock protein HtpX